MPAPLPPLDVCARRGLFADALSLLPTKATYRDKTYNVRLNEPQLTRKGQLAGYLDEVVDLEAMIVLAPNDPAPVPNGLDGLTIGAQSYRIVSVQEDIGPGCYQLTLAKRRPSA